MARLVIDKKGCNKLNMIDKTSKNIGWKRREKAGKGWKRLENKKVGKGWKQNRFQLYLADNITQKVGNGEKGWKRPNYLKLLNKKLETAKGWKLDLTNRNNSIKG